MLFKYVVSLSYRLLTMFVVEHASFAFLFELDFLLCSWLSMLCFCSKSILSYACV